MYRPSFGFAVLLFLITLDNLNCSLFEFSESLLSLLRSAVEPIQWIFSFQLLYFTYAEFVLFPFIIFQLIFSFHSHIISFVFFSSWSVVSFSFWAHLRQLVCQVLSSQFRVWTCSEMSVKFFPFNELYFPVSLYVLWFCVANQTFQFYNTVTLGIGFSPFPKVALLLVEGCSRLFRDGHFSDITVVNQWPDRFPRIRNKKERARVWELSPSAGCLALAGTLFEGQPGPPTALP